ncbi:hypothetical protein EC912_103217 [Luteibacter rhizovicinus]|uniref:Uncharacterized protein n=1 Tax=Luteibacter rhizovicinus TaxID=242606 RepID=A0A4R3YQU7_9GAMM|nr:hypothetical protein [Luteibacter rhizovicinus]TCV94732.1 hypothetical protein EC912_103217 [Luteibacter rhizovicinus]
MNRITKRHRVCRMACIAVAVIGTITSVAASAAPMGLVSALVACDGGFFRYMAGHPELADYGKTESPSPGYTRFVGNVADSRYLKAAFSKAKDEGAGLQVVGFMFDPSASGVFWGVYLSGRPSDALGAVAALVDSAQGRQMKRDSSYVRVEIWDGSAWVAPRVAASKGWPATRMPERVLELSEDTLPDGSRGTLLACSLQNDFKPIDPVLTKDIFPDAVKAN